MAFVLWFLRSLAFIGLVNNLYFILTHHFRPIKKHTNLCAGKRCDDLVKTPYAHLFIVPNYVPGFLYFTVIFWSSFTLYFTMAAFKLLIYILTWFAAAISIYLFSILRFKLKMHCMTCYISESAAVLIAILYLFLV